MTTGLLEQFGRSLAGLPADMHVADGLAGARAMIGELVGDAPVLVDQHPDLAGLESTAGAWDAEVGVSVARWAAAGTGTLAIMGGSRTTGVTPPHHVVLVRSGDLVPDYADLIACLVAGELPSWVRLTTGPSRSGDIELKTIYGLHGPGRLSVVVADVPATDAPPNPDGES